jgi:hypothetical protein
MRATDHTGDRAVAPVGAALIVIGAVVLSNPLLASLFGST